MKRRSDPINYNANKRMRLLRRHDHWSRLLAMTRSLYAIMVTVFASTSFATIIHVPADYPTIQQGINASFDGDTVLVAPGIYVENINFNGHNIVLGSMFLTTGISDYRSSTIIDGNSSGPVVDFVNGEDSTATIFGFTIRNGLALNGGGIHCNYSDPAIRNNIVSGNTVTNHGAGISCSSSHSVIADNIVENNIAIPPMDGGAQGGGIYCGYGEATIIRNIIRGNISGPSSINVGSGGGISCYLSNSYIYGNTIMENKSSLTGGGISCGFSSPTIENNLIINNQCGYTPTNTHGGAINCGLSFVIIRNNTIYGNAVTGYGGAVYFSGNDSLLITNNICWNNSAAGGPELYIYGGNPTVTYNDIRGGWSGEGNIDVEPRFRNPGNGNFHLMSTACGDSINSPCIDAGDPNIDDDPLNCSWGLGTNKSDMGAYGGNGTISNLCSYVTGDINDSGEFNAQDVSSGVLYFKGEFSPPYVCQCTAGKFWYVAGDVNASCDYNGLDITYAVAYLKGGSNLQSCPDCISAD